MPLPLRPAQVPLPAAFAGHGQSTLTLLSSGFLAAQRHEGSHRVRSGARTASSACSHYAQSGLRKASSWCTHSARSGARKASSWCTTCHKWTCLISGSHLGVQRQQMVAFYPFPRAEWYTGQPQETRRALACGDSNIAPKITPSLGHSNHLSRHF